MTVLQVVWYILMPPFAVFLLYRATCERGRLRPGLRRSRDNRGRRARNVRRYLKDHPERDPDRKPRDA